MPDHVFGAFYGVLYSIYLLRELHLDPFLLGIVISAGGVGSLVGSFFASRVVNALGIGRALVATAIVQVDVQHAGRARTAEGGVLPTIREHAELLPAVTVRGALGVRGELSVAGQG